MARRLDVGAEGFIRLLTPEQLDVKEHARRECALAVRGDPPKGSPRGGKGGFPGFHPPSSISHLASGLPASSKAPYRPVFVANNKGSSNKGKGKGWRT